MEKVSLRPSNDCSEGGGGAVGALTGVHSRPGDLQTNAKWLNLNYLNNDFYIPRHSW